MRAIVETSAGILAAQAVAVTKVYGHGSGAVTALDGVTVASRRAPSRPALLLADPTPAAVLDRIGRRER
jgi:hypothetical protein